MNTPKRILVVDDDEAIRTSLKKLLADAGYSAVLAPDGQGAVSSLSSQEFDLLILDLELPKVTGWDILDQVLANQPLLPVIVLTAFAQDCEPGATAGADLVLEKPPDVPLLLRAIERFLHEPADQRCRRNEAKHRIPASPILRSTTDAVIAAFPGSPTTSTENK